MQLPAEQTSLGPQPRRVGQQGRKPFVSQNATRRRQPINERALPAQRPSIAAPGLPPYTQTSCRIGASVLCCLVNLARCTRVTVRPTGIYATKAPADEPIAQ